MFSRQHQQIEACGFNTLKLRHIFVAYYLTLQANQVFEYSRLRNIPVGLYLIAMHIPEAIYPQL